MHKLNYNMMLLCLALIAIGFVLLHMPSGVFHPVKMYVAPIVLLAGYLGMGATILYSPE